MQLIDPQYNGTFSRSRPTTGAAAVGTKVKGISLKKFVEAYTKAIAQTHTMRTQAELRTRKQQ